MDVLMPQLGETVAEGKITRWFKSPGDAVKPGDLLFEIETDKVSMEVPSTTAGILGEVRVRAGEVVPVGAVVAVISRVGASEAADSSASAASLPSTTDGRARDGTRPPLRGDELTSKPAPLQMDPFREVRTPERNFGPARLPGGTAVTPLARRLAAEAGTDLNAIAPSGPHGRILARDVEAAIARRMQPVVHAPVTPSAARVTALYEPGTYEEIPLQSLRRTIAARLTEAKQRIPHFYLTVDIATDRLNEVRAEANSAAPKDADGHPAYKLSINDFVIKALALALQRVPAANAVWAEDRILRFRHSDIGVAVALDDGLITPVIREAERKSLVVISAEMKDLAARARAKKLLPHEYQGGASAVSNLGMYGVREFSAIINPPHATLLAVGAVQRRPVETADGGFRFASLMTVTLSCDHRVIDGALGAQLLAAFRHYIEHPVALMV